VAVSGVAPAAVDFSPPNFNAKAQRIFGFPAPLRLCVFAFNSVAVRPPQTAFGRPAGTLPGSAPVPVAVFAVAPAAVDFSPPNFNAKAQRRKGAKNSWFSCALASLRLCV
jgi:hypothetical protein